MVGDLHTLKDGLDKALDTLVIEKTEDANPEDEAARYGIDLKRWTIVSKKDEKQYKKVVRRFYILRRIMRTNTKSLVGLIYTNKEKRIV